jgi:hypothetical protein
LVQHCRKGLFVARERPEHAEVPEIGEERKHYVVAHICDL